MKHGQEMKWLVIFRSYHIYLVPFTISKVCKLASPITWPPFTHRNFRRQIKHFYAVRRRILESKDGALTSDLVQKQDKNKQYNPYVYLFVSVGFSALSSMTHFTYQLYPKRITNLVCVVILSHRSINCYTKFVNVLKI